MLPCSGHTLLIPSGNIGRKFEVNHRFDPQNGSFSPIEVHYVKNQDSGNHYRGYKCGVFVGDGGIGPTASHDRRW